MTKPENIVSLGSFTFDRDAVALLGPDGTKAALRPQTAQVLSILAAEPGQLVTKESLMSAVWTDTHVTDDSLVQCVSEIRKALGSEGGGLLVTVPKHGYRLVATAVHGRSASDVPGHSTTKTRYRIARKWRSFGLGAIALLLVLFFGISTVIPRHGATPADRITIAVLPFENLSGDVEQDYLSSGLAEDLLTDLSRIGSMVVLSRNVTFGLRTDPGAALATVEKLGANYLIDGSVQSDGSQIRISVQLVQLPTGENIWAERYDRQVGDLFEVQDDVRNNIIDALEIRLAPFEKKRLSSTGTSDVAAYDLFLRGRYYETSLTREGVTRAIEFYRRAIDADPGYTQAYARLANMYDFSSRFGWGRNAEADRTLALEMAERSVRLDPENPFAHWTFGRVLSRLGWDASSRDRAIGEMEKAIELDPNYADAHAFISLIYVGGGQHEEARKSIDKAFEISQAPASWYFQNRGIIHYFEQDYESAVTDFSIAVEQNPTAAFSRFWLAAAYAMHGDIEDAEWEIEEASALDEPGRVDDVLLSNPIIRDPEFKRQLAAGLQKAGMPN